MKGQHLYSFSFSLDFVYLSCEIFKRYGYHLGYTHCVRCCWFSFFCSCRLIIAKIYFLGNLWCRKIREKRKKRTQNNHSVAFLFHSMMILLTLISILSFGFTSPFHCSNKRKINPERLVCLSFSCFYR